MLAKVKENPEKYKAWKDAVRKGTIKANKARIGEKHSEQHKDKIGLGNKRNWDNNPERRRLMSEKMKEIWAKRRLIKEGGGAL